MTPEDVRWDWSYSTHSDGIGSSITGMPARGITKSLTSGTYPVAPFGTSRRRLDEKSNLLLVKRSEPQVSLREMFRSEAVAVLQTSNPTSEKDRARD